ncbi:mitochondrial carrier [Serendipita vermifera]|nr:mitochondrial carrier [Serendipita vermifera]
MASLHPATTPSTSERSPLLAKPSTTSIERNANDAENIPRSSAEDSDDDDFDVPEPWTKEDKIHYALLTIFILIVAITTYVAIKDSDKAKFDWRGALKGALGGGLSGAAAMPLRTIMNYQYRYGTTTRQAAATLYHDGGYRRYYSGLGAALVQAPVARFGDTAANVGIFALLDSNPVLKDLPVWAKTAFAAIAAASFRIILTPIDTLKTTLQTQGRAALPILRRRVHKYGISSLWYGSLATAAATLVGFYPWFGTYNFLQEHIPKPKPLVKALLRQALIGFIASVVSDTISNSLRVIKTYRQVNSTKISYRAAAREVIRNEGLRGLLGRGLKTRILANGLQGLMFSVLWKLFLDLWNSKT